MSIQYHVGDATKPGGPGPKILVHICNDAGGWGKGFVVAISRRWPAPERQYRAWHRGEVALPFEMGQVQFVLAEDHLWVANLVGQHGMTALNGVPPIRYEAIRTGLRAVASRAAELTASVHMPRIGCGLAGGTWDNIEPLIEEELAARGIAVHVYDFPQR